MINDTFSWFRYINNVGQYYQTDYGRFSSGLVREIGNDTYVLVAVADKHEVIEKEYALPCDKKAIQAFADYYQIPVKWRETE